MRLRNPTTSRTMLTHWETETDWSVERRWKKKTIKIGFEKKREINYFHHMLPRCEGIWMWRIWWWENNYWILQRDWNSTQRPQETRRRNRTSQPLSWKDFLQNGQRNKADTGRGLRRVRKPMHFAFPLRTGFLKYNGIGHGSNYKSQMDIWRSEALNQIEDKIQHKRWSSFSK